MRSNLVTHLAKYFPPEYGGMESVTRALAEGSAVHGRSVDVICFTRKYSSGVSILAGVRVIRHRELFSASSQPISLRYFFRAVRSMYTSAIVHVHMPNAVAAIAVVSAIRPRAKLVIHWHSDVIKQRFLGWLLGPIFRAALKRSDFIIATSAEYIEGSKDLVRFAGKCRAVPIGIKLPAIDIRPPEGFLVGRFENGYVLAVGRLVGYKGYDFLLQAIAKTDPDISLVIVGSGPLENTIIESIADLGLVNRVVLLEGLKEEELRWLYCHCRFFVMASVSRAEAFGVVQLEAMSAKKPVVSTRIPGSGVAWVNEHGVSGLTVPPRDVHALADAMETLWHDEVLYRRLSVGAEERMMSMFQEASMINAIEGIYDELLES